MKPIDRQPWEIEEGEIYLSENPGRSPSFLVKGTGSSSPEEIYDIRLIEELQHGSSRWAAEWRRRNYSSDFSQHMQLAMNSGAQQPQQPQRQQHKKPVPDFVVEFVRKHYEAAQKLAQSLGNGVTAAEVLAIAGNESGWWGDHHHSPDSKAKHGNFFGLHGKGPAGTYYTADNKTPTPIFQIDKNDDGFTASGQVFVELVKDGVQNPVQPPMA